MYTYILFLSDGIPVCGKLSSLIVMSSSDDDELVVEELVEERFRIWPFSFVVLSGRIVLVLDRIV